MKDMPLVGPKVTVRYLFDTDTVSALFKAQPPTVLVNRLSQVPAENQYISTVTIFEICYGAYRSETPSKYLAFLENRLLPQVGVLDFDDTAARIAGRIRAERDRAGRPISPLDLEIAATALANGCILVTGNMRHFEGMAGLEVENWMT